MRALVVDAYDSFVYIIVQYLETLGVEVEVRRNDKVTSDVVRELAPDFVVLGPGPGHPADAGYVEIIKSVSSEMPTLGICLGHQAIGLAYGAEVKRAEHLMHGKTSTVEHDSVGLFSGHQADFHATRYHSLIVDKTTIPSELKISAVAKDDGYVMGLRHHEHPVESVQFHPESILTERGLALFANFIATHVGEIDPISESISDDEVHDVD